MSKQQDKIESLFCIQSRTELRGAANDPAIKLTLPQAQRLAVHARSLVSEPLPLRLGIVHTYTSDLLDPWFDLAAALEGFRLDVYHAPYGVTHQEAQPNSGLVAHRPDLTLLLLRREDLHPDLAQPLAAFDSAQQATLRQQALDSVRGVIGQLRRQPVGQLIVTLLPSVLSPGLGMYDAQSERSESGWWASFKADIAAYLRQEIQASLLLDLDELLLHVGRESFFDARLWYSARFPFAATAARELTRRVVALGAVAKLPKAKVIVLDADNTLWGGIIGEDGMHGIAIGPDYPGNAYLDFQRRLLDFQQRGFVLAMCSKNNPADVDQVLKEHPHQLLREQHFAARRVNWLPKPDNLVSLAEELNLGLESFVFVDDSDHECALVRQQLPQVEVIQTPAKPVFVPACLDKVARLEVLAVTAEDLAKTALYAQERQRRVFQENIAKDGADARSHLASLQMKMRIGIDQRAHLVRLAQLTQKTNQFNLTTHRYDEQQMLELINSPDWWVAHFTLEDIFGNSGIVGLALIQVSSPKQALLETFLMSCRVIGREAEAAFLHALLRRLQSQGIEEVLAMFVPTRKNALAERFLPEQGFEAYDGRYRYDFAKSPAKQDSEFPVTIEFEDSAS